MTKKEADEWAKDSKHKEKFFHATNKERKVKIEKEGFKKSTIGSSTGNNGLFGRGFYLSGDEIYTGTYGPVKLKCKINIKNPKYFANVSEYEKFLEKYNFGDGLFSTLMKNTGGKITKLLKKQGYDSVVFQDGIETILFNSKQIVVIK